jgi:hypothetical protein
MGKQEVSFLENINEILSICFKNGIKVYPVVCDKNSFFIEVDYNGRKKRGSTTYRWKTEQQAMQNKIIELYEELAKRIQSRGQDLSL